MRLRGDTRAAILGVVTVCGLRLSVAAAPQATTDLSTLMAAVGERVSGYYHQAQHVICTETSVMQPIEHGWDPAGMPRTVESELHIETGLSDGDGIPLPTIARDVRKVNGRAPRDRDRMDRSACTDPEPLSTAPLVFLMTGHGDDYRFTSVKEGREGDRPALIVEFASAVRRSRPELVEDPWGHDECFDWNGPVALKGRVWVDPETHDVLRLERRLAGSVDIQVPWALQRKYGFNQWMTIDQDDLWMRFKTVTFTDPDETLLLPESIETTTILRGGLQSMRRTETYRDYRRFVTSGRIKGS